LPVPAKDEDVSAREQAILQWIARHGASFFDALHDAGGGGFPAETVDALWNLVWRGQLTNDTFLPLRAFTAHRDSRRRQEAAAPAFRSRRLVPRTAEGRWTLAGGQNSASATQRATSIARQLLTRHGVLTREALASEGLKGGFSSVYAPLKAMDDAGRVRRGYFVAGLGATQFAMPGALDLLRSLRTPAGEPHAALLSATDPASPYGTSLPWPLPNLTRVVGAAVVIVDGDLRAYLSRGNREIAVVMPDDEPFRSRHARATARAIVAFARGDGRGQRPMFITTVNGVPATDHWFSVFLEDTGFLKGGVGLHVPRRAGEVIDPSQPA
jgi:ATP-dependent Lhr-like helicase